MVQSKFYWVIIYSGRVERIYGFDGKGVTWDEIRDLLTDEEPIAIVRGELA